MQENYGGIVTIQRYSSEQDAFMDLLAGRVDVEVGDTPVIVEWLKQQQGDQYGLIGDKVSSQAWSLGNGIAVKKGNDRLRNALNKALKVIKANGRYTQLVQRYFQQD